jgi:hypothetical protein
MAAGREGEEGAGGGGAAPSRSAFKSCYSALLFLYQSGMASATKNRRKSVAFADEALGEAPRSARTRRQSQLPTLADPEPATAAAAPPPEPSAASRATRSRRAAAPVESDKGFKFKRQKTAPKPAVPPPQSTAAPPTIAPTAAPVQMEVEQPAAAAVKAPVVAPVAAPVAAPIVAPAAASPPKPAPPPKPSLLEGAPKELLYAIHEVCTAASQQAAGAAGAAAALPTMGLAIAACMKELHTLGVTHAPPPNPASAALNEKGARLTARVAELEAAIAQWDATAQAPLPSPAATEAVMTDETRLIADLPPLPPLEAQLGELGALAGLCSEQVEAAARQVQLAVAHAEADRQRLAKAAHKVTFKGYLDVDEPKALLRNLAAF